MCCPGKSETEERLVETPDFRPVGQKYLGLGLVSKQFCGTGILYLVGSDANPPGTVLELNRCWIATWCLKSWQVGLVWEIFIPSVLEVSWVKAAQRLLTKHHRLVVALEGKEPACQRRVRRDWVPSGLGRCPGGGHTINPLQDAYLRIPWIEECGQAIVNRVAKSRTLLSLL